MNNKEIVGYIRSTQINLVNQGNTKTFGFTIENEVEGVFVQTPFDIFNISEFVRQCMYSHQKVAVNYDDDTSLINNISTGLES